MEGFGNTCYEAPAGYIDIHNKPKPKSVWDAFSRLGSTVFEVAKGGDQGYNGDDVKQAGGEFALMVLGQCKYLGSIEMDVWKRMQCDCAGCASWDNLKCLREREEARKEEARRQAVQCEQMRKKEELHPDKARRVRYFPLAFLEPQGGDSFKVTERAASYRMTPFMDDRDGLNTAFSDDIIEGQVVDQGGWLRVEGCFNVQPNEKENRGVYQPPKLFASPAPKVHEAAPAGDKPKGPWGRSAKPSPDTSGQAPVDVVRAEKKPDPPTTDKTRANFVDVDLLGGDAPEKSATVAESVDLLGGGVAESVDLLGVGLRDAAAQQETKSIESLAREVLDGQGYDESLSYRPLE